LRLDRLVASITAVEGLGPWTAQYLALQLGGRDACPIGDLALHRALDERLEAVALRKVVERRRPWRAFRSHPSG
jgi:AraC family transcriptional regulator, regulatory protein of adaptative response / DNA-3-methyladenine glycosylase II